MNNVSYMSRMASNLHLVRYVMDWVDLLLLEYSVLWTSRLYWPAEGQFNGGDTISSIFLYLVFDTSQLWKRFTTVPMLEIIQGIACIRDYCRILARFLRDDSRREISISRDWWKMHKSPLANNQYSVLPSIPPYLLPSVYSVMCGRPIECSRDVWQHGSVPYSPPLLPPPQPCLHWRRHFVTDSRYCLEHYRCTVFTWDDHLVVPTTALQVSLTCKVATSGVEAIDSLDWALTCLMWHVQTYLDFQQYFT